MQGFPTKVSRCLNATAAGSTDITNATGVDMQGFDGVLFIAALGTLSAGQRTWLTAQGSADNQSWNSFTNDPETGQPLDGDSNKLLVLDLYKPVTRYVKPVVRRSNANAAIDGIFAILYHASKAPVVSDSTVSQFALWVSP
jgi:hypothetical protein